MSYLLYLYLLVHGGTMCLFCLSLSCVPCVASFSGLSIFLLPLQYSLTFIYYLKF